MKSDISSGWLDKGAANAHDTFDPVTQALPWVLEAGNPYYESLFGGPAAAEKVLEAWMHRRTSEVSISRVQFLVSNEELAGGFVALGGGELRKARKADSIALLSSSMGLPDRETLIERMRSLSDLFPPVADDEYYLSKLGLRPQHRGKGLARILVERYLEDGRERGYTRYRLDVEAGNEIAIRCYQSAGFRFCGQSESEDGVFRYCAMRYNRVPV
jgi:ribosomal protein S18 acetylase RimI-like enzyme